MARKKSSQGRKAKKKRPNGVDRDVNVAPGGTSSTPVWTGGKNAGSGANAGPVPNLFWGAISIDELRMTHRFVALPEPETLLPLSSPAAARYLRQDSPSWRQLHAGVLTTGLLKEALGLREPLAARVVGGRNESSHAPLLAAFRHLQQSSQLPVLLKGPREEQGPAGAAGGEARKAEEQSCAGPGLVYEGREDEQSTMRCRRAAVVGLTELLRQQWGRQWERQRPGQGQEVLGRRQEQEPRHHHPQKPQQQQQQDPSSQGPAVLQLSEAAEAVALLRPRVAAAEVAVGETGEQVRGEADWPAAHEARFRRCFAALSTSGLAGVRCGWGKAQEAAALGQLLAIFPCSTLHEVGLCWVPPALTAPWPHLPPLAASPDAIIAHHLPLDPRATGALQLALQPQRQQRQIGQQGQRQQRGQIGQQGQRQQRGQIGQQGQRQQGGQMGQGQGQLLLLQLRELLALVPLATMASADADGYGSSSTGSGDGCSGDVGAALTGDGSGPSTSSDGYDRDDGGDDGGSSDDVDGEEGEGRACCSGGGGGGGAANPADDVYESDDDEDGPVDDYGVAVAFAAIAGTTTYKCDSESDDAQNLSEDTGTVSLSLSQPSAHLKGRSAAAAAGGSGASVYATKAAAVVGTATVAATAMTNGRTDQSDTVARPPASNHLAALLARVCGPPAASPSGTAAVNPHATAAAATSADGSSLPLGFGPGAATPGGSPQPVSAPPAWGPRCWNPHGELLAAVLDSPWPALLLCDRCGGRAQPLADAPRLQEQQQGQRQDQQQGQQQGASEWASRPLVWCYCDSGNVTVVASAAAAARTGDNNAGDEGGARCQTSTRAANASALGAATEAAAAQDGSAFQYGKHTHLVLREVVEVKNTCPFGIRQVRRGGKGRLFNEVVLSDRGPRNAVSPLWVPQLQLHMMAAGCQSGLLVSRSATKGTTVFRMLRDDDYLARMMGLLERFHAEYVLRGRPPPTDMFARQPDYTAFLAATARLARSAVPLLPPGTVWRPTQEGCGGRGLDGERAGGWVLDRGEAFIRRVREEEEGGT